MVWSAEQHLRPVEEILATEVTTPNKIQSEDYEQDNLPTPTSTAETDSPDSNDETKNPFRRFMRRFGK